MKWNVKLKDGTFMVGERKLLRDNLVEVGFWLTDVKDERGKTLGPIFIPWNSVLYIEEIL